MNIEASGLVPFFDPIVAKYFVSFHLNQLVDIFHKQNSLQRYDDKASD